MPPLTLEKLDRIRKLYREQSWRRKNPTFAFVVESLLVLVATLGTIYYQSILAMFRSVHPFREHNVPIHQLAYVERVLDSITSWQQYFFTPKAGSGGNNFFALLSMLTPIILVASYTVIPALVLGYMLWLTINYYRDIINISLSLLWALLDYAVSYVRAIIANVKIRFNISPIKFFKIKISSRLGKLGGIGISTRYPKFYQIMGRWRQVNLDPVILRERVVYVRKVNEYRRRYLVDPFAEGPFDTYVVSPVQRALVELNFLNRVITDRTTEVATKTLGYWGKRGSEATTDKIYRYYRRAKRKVGRFKLTQWLYLIAGIVTTLSGILTLVFVSYFQLPATVLVIIGLVYVHSSLTKAP